MSTEEIVRKQIIEKAWADASFKAKLVTDPKAALKEAFDITIPDSIELTVLEENPEKFYLVLPPHPSEMFDPSTDNATW